MKESEDQVESLSGIDMIDYFLEKERYGALKRRAEDRQGWRVWLPATCRMAEH